MNPSFKSMSNLAADAEDLLLRIGRSSVPEVRALAQPVSIATDRLKQELRARVRRLPPPAEVFRADARGLCAAAAALLAVCAFAWVVCKRQA